MPVFNLISLTDAPERLISQGVEVLSDARIPKWLQQGPAVLASRREHDIGGSSLHYLVLVDGQVVGFIGWLSYPPIPGALETSTYLAPDLWGSGLSAQLKTIQIAAARAAHRVLVASVHVANGRSLSSMSRLFPDLVSERVFESHKPRWAMVWTLVSADAGETEDRLPSNAVAGEVDIAVLGRIGR